MNFRKLLARAAIVVVAIVAAGASWVAFNVLAPCEYHNPELMQGAKLVATEVERHYAASGSLPSKDDIAARLPKDASWDATALAEGGFQVRYFGIGMGFDTPWVKYHSTSGTFVCHFR